MVFDKFYKGVVDRVVSPSQAAYLDIALDAGLNVTIVGDKKVRKPVVEMIHECATEKYGTITDIADEQPRTRHGWGDDYISIDLDTCEPKYAKHYFEMLCTCHKGLAQMTAKSPLLAIKRLEKNPYNVPRAMMMASDIFLDVKKDKKPYRTKIEETIGIDPCNKDILMNNAVFIYNKKIGELEFSGRSYVLEKVMMKRDKRREDIIGELKTKENLFLKYVVNIRKRRRAGYYRPKT